jgi:hypothetical protein
MAITNGQELIDPIYYSKDGPPHALWKQLRENSPVHACTPKGFEPFRAITRHADIVEISRNPDTYRSQTGGIVVMRPGDMEIRKSGEGFGAMRVIIETDPPEHRSLRKVARSWFTPRALGHLDQAINESARQLVDKLAGTSGEGECDFATDVAVAHPLRILSTILGIPREEEPRVLRLTNQLFASDDPELQREGEDRQQAIVELGLELFQFFSGIIEDRRANPRNDLASVLANGKIDGELMGPMETVGYFLITFTAGHDTTKNSLVGGMRALIDNPQELDKLRRNPELVPSAVEEIVRWTSPVNYMKRTLSRDIELHGEKLHDGEAVVLFYASANRDETVFEDPFSFRVDRDPNPHLGFGIGEHFCLGAHLARRSQLALFRELIGRLEEIELIGEPEQIQSSFVVGLKHLPIRYRIRAS